MMLGAGSARTPLQHHHREGQPPRSAPEVVGEMLAEFIRHNRGHRHHPSLPGAIRPRGTSIAEALPRPRQEASGAVPRDASGSRRFAEIKRRVTPFDAASLDADQDWLTPCAGGARLRAPRTLVRRRGMPVDPYQRAHGGYPLVAFVLHLDDHVNDLASCQPARADLCPRACRAPRNGIHAVELCALVIAHALRPISDVEIVTDYCGLLFAAPEGCR